MRNKNWDMIRARGTLTQKEAGLLVGATDVKWCKWETGLEEMPAGLLDGFKEKAAATYPSYRCNLRYL